MFKKTKISRGLLLAFGGSLALSALPALAQQAAQLDRVEITGSAIKRIDAETAVPVTVVKIEDLKKQGITTVEQVVSTLSAAQVQQGTAAVIGLGTGGAAFADLRGLGANKTLVLLNGRRIANNAYDSSAPDLNMIPFAGLERVEVLRDGASSLYGTDAIGGVINFITRKDYTGGTVTLGYDSPQASGGKSYSANAGFGVGDLAKDGFNVFGFVNYEQQDAIHGNQRDFGNRIPGGLSSNLAPANYYQAGDVANPAAKACNSEFLLGTFSDGKLGCRIATSTYVDYIPKTERTSGLLKGTLDITPNAQLGLEYFAAESKISYQIAPVPYGGMIVNRSSRYYPGNAGAPFTPTIPLSPTFVDKDQPDGLPGFVNVNWRDYQTGPRMTTNTNTQQRFVASLQGTVSEWDYQAAFTYNENKVKENLAGYTNGDVIYGGFLDGTLNPFGAQTAAGQALIAGAGLSGTLQNAKGTVTGGDIRVGRDFGDWFGAGRPTAFAAGAEYQHQNFKQAAEFDFASAVVQSTGVDPNTLNEGSRDVFALYAELAMPILKTLDVTLSLRYDNFSDFGNTTNPKVSFRYQPVEQVLVRGSYSTGFRAPSLYEINQSQVMTNTQSQSDPVNCPDGVHPIPGKPQTTCENQFQTILGGNKELQPEKSKSATLGFVFQPTTDLNVALDFWWINLSQTIGSIPEDNLFADPTTFAAYFIRNTAGNLSTNSLPCVPVITGGCGYVDQRTQNLGGTKSNGLDIGVSYKLNAGDAGLFNFGLQSTVVLNYEYQDYKNGPWNDNLGIYSGTGPIFRWKHNLVMSWSKGPFGAGLAGYYKSGYTDQDPENHVASYTTWDLYGSWQAVPGLSLTAGIRNLFDRDPPFTNQDGTFKSGGFDPRFTSPVGRVYYIRGTYSF